MARPCIACPIRTSSGPAPRPRSTIRLDGLPSLQAEGSFAPVLVLWLAIGRESPGGEPLPRSEPHMPALRNLSPERRHGGLPQEVRVPKYFLFLEQFEACFA
jgi:hypothetical protein